MQHSPYLIIDNTLPCDLPDLYEGIEDNRMKSEAWLVEFARHLRAQLRVRTFALWEVVLIILLVGKHAPWWLALPGFVLWLFLRRLGDEK